MSKFKRDKVMPRYLAIVVVFSLLALAIIGKALYIMTAKKDYWQAVAKRMKQENVTLPAARGNILSCDGQLMASSIPEYTVFIDFQAGDPNDTAWIKKRDTLWRENVDSLCRGLSRIFKTKTPEEFKAYLEKGRNKVITNKKTNKTTVGARYWRIWPRRVSYNTFCEISQLPYLSLPKNKGGFNYEELPSRRRPFGSLALRTVGEIGSQRTRTESGYIVTIDTARYGLELAYDSMLRGKSGLMNREKVLYKRLPIPLIVPENGYDIVSTIDVGIQDLAEKALRDELREVKGDMGVAIVMEVKTGDVKAMVNLTQLADSSYREQYNNAINYRCEPGSVFKTASVLFALDEGVVDTSYVIHTGGGVVEMHGRPMKDHNWRNGGYGDINVARSLEVSSNVGVSHIIDRFFQSNPQRYVDGMRRLGITADLKLPIVGYQRPFVKDPSDKKAEKGLYWSKTTLPWMSIGYESQIAPINTVAFYNAIANDGKLLRPRFVKALQRNGEVVREFPTEVINPQIAKPQSIKTIQTVLKHVVSQGLGKKAGSRLFDVSGKTGTAQVAQGNSGYKNGTVQYWLSFAGFFPSDKPRYSCIVCLRKMGLPASGGGMAGKVFHQISEGIMSRDLRREAVDAHDEQSDPTPEVKEGNLLAAGYVLSKLNIPVINAPTASYADGNPIWGHMAKHASGVKASVKEHNKGLVPDVHGMGARDAVYMLESRGVTVAISGRGRVAEQSIAPGTTIRNGMTCTLKLTAK